MLRFKSNCSINGICFE